MFRSPLGDSKSELLEVNESFKLTFNRYRRGLETCPQANLAKSGRKYFLLFFPTRPSDEYDSASSRKYSRPLWDLFAYIA